MGLLRNAAHYLTGSLFSQLLNSARLFLLAKIILPDEYGLYVAAITFQGLAPIACLGTVETLLKEVPFFQGRGDRESVHRVESAVFGSIILATGLLVVIEVAVELFPGRIGVAGDLVTSRLAIIVSIFSLFTAFYSHRCAAREDFVTAAMIEAVRAIAVFAGVLLFAWWGKGRGAVLGLLVAEMCVAAFTFIRSRKLHGPIGPYWDKRELLRIVKVGFPITVVWWVYMVHASIGRVCAGTLLGSAAVGLYGFAMSTAMVFSMLPNIIGRVTYPRLNKALGAQMNNEAVDETLLLPTRMLAMVWPFFQILLWFTLPFAFERYFQNYVAALAATQVLILGSYFGIMVRNGANYLIATNHQAKMLIYVVISLAVNIVLALALVAIEWGITGIAIGSAVAAPVLAGLIWWKTLTLANLGRARQAAIGLGFIVPLLIMLAVLAVVELTCRWLELTALWHFLGGCSVAGAGYLMCLLAFRNTRNDLTMLLSRLLNTAKHLLKKANA